MMLYYHTKFGCKQTSSLEDRVEIVMFWFHKPSLWPWHWRQFSAWHSGTWCCITIHQVWHQNDLQFIRYHPDKHSLTFWTFAVTLILNAVIQFLNRTLQLIMLYYRCNFGCKQTNSLEDRVEIVIFGYISPHCDCKSFAQPSLVTSPLKDWLQDFNPVLQHFHQLFSCLYHSASIHRHPFQTSLFILGHTHPAYSFC